jgi:hypothetical protein
MPIWIVTTPPDYEPALIPFDFVEADSEADALIFCAKEFAKEDWPHLIAEEIDAGPAIAAYASLNRQYTINKLEWDGAMYNAHFAALQEWGDQFDLPSIPESF